MHRLLVVKNRAAFLTTYPEVEATLIAGEFVGSLNNAGERIKVNDATGNTIVDFVYGDADPWPERADGAGGSLELIDPLTTPSDQMGKYSRWSGSTRYGGTPGAARVDSAGVVINEVLTNGNPPLTNLDAIELFNPTAEPIDIGGWYLSDSAENLLKYQIPLGTLLDAGSYRVFDERDFNPTPQNPGVNDFALSGSRGDDVWLVTTDDNGDIRSFVDDVHFGAARIGESFGRAPNGTGRLAPLSDVTLGEQNAAPRVGPIVISEINYHPAPPSPAARQLDPSITEDDLEFIEIHNPTTEVINLTGWQLNGGVTYDFPSETTLDAGQSLVIVSFNPDASVNAARVAAFQTQYGIDRRAKLVGGYSGQLRDSTEQVQLQRPGSLVPNDPDFLYGLWEDEILYDDVAPWPAQADGGGASLTRLLPADFGNAASSWIASQPTPGTTGNTPGDFNGDGQIDLIDVDLLRSNLKTGDLRFDLNADGTTDHRDLVMLIQDILGTTFGDANLSGVFDSGDLVQVFQAGEYEDGIPGNSTFGEGDWNGDGDFTSGDLVLAFQTGHYGGIRSLPPFWRIRQASASGIPT